MPNSVVVVGAGAFGGWIALHLVRRGANVTLVDPWGAGNSLSSSGGETRVLRYLYGKDRIYTELTLRSAQMWKENQEVWDEKIFEKTGQLWMFQSDDDYARSGLEDFARLNIELQELNVATAQERFPQFCFDDINSVFYEPNSGILHARRSCQIVCREFQKEGGKLVKAAVSQNLPLSDSLSGINLTNGDSLYADQFVFACGSWLGNLFPDLLGNHILPTRQEVHFFSLPVGNKNFDIGSLPTWVDVGEFVRYGLPNIEERGLKVADDTRGPVINPSNEERIPSSKSIEDARAYLNHRFPSMHDTRMNESRVCQYENSPDGHLIVDKHPKINNVWIIGGGSGHGFKFAPALGEHVTDCLLSNAKLEPSFSINRLKTLESRTTQFQAKNKQ